MNLFNFDLKKIFLVAILLSLPLLSINMEQKPNTTIWINQPFSTLGSFIQDIFFGFSSGVKGTTAQYVNLINIKKENARLLSSNNELGTRLEAFSELQKENDRLRSLLDFKSSTKMQLVGAQVIGRDLVPDHSTITINKGTRDGIKAGQAVLTLGGAIGYVFKPNTFNSHVMLITDRYSVVDGVVQRTRAHGIVEGKSSSQCSMKYVDRSEDVKVGDLVVTGGLDNIFPKGYPLAIVEAVERKTFSVSLKVELRPIVDPNKAEEVFVVTNANHEDLTERYLIHDPATQDNQGNNPLAPTKQEK